MVYFQSKNPNLGKFWRALESYCICPFGIFYGPLAIVWYFGIFSRRFGKFCQEKSGNPGQVLENLDFLYLGC
jgi:hypothetical protein